MGEESGRVVEAVARPPVADAVQHYGALGAVEHPGRPAQGFPDLLRLREASVGSATTSRITVPGIPKVRHAVMLIARHQQA